MEISAKVIWGVALFSSPFVIAVMLLMCSGRWLKWVLPLIFIVPFAFYTIGGNRQSCLAIFKGILLAVFFYGFYILLVALVNALRKPKKELGK